MDEFHSTCMERNLIKNKNIRVNYPEILALELEKEKSRVLVSVRLVNDDNKGVVKILIG